MDNKINFTARSNAYFVITKKGWQKAIPDMAYSQINANRERLEKFARKIILRLLLPMLIICFLNFIQVVKVVFCPGNWL